MKEFNNIIEAMNFRTICPLCKSNLISNNLKLLNKRLEFDIFDDRIIFNKLQNNNDYSIFKFSNSEIEFQIDTHNYITNCKLEQKIEYTNIQPYNQPLFTNNNYLDSSNLVTSYCKCGNYSYDFIININFFNKIAIIYFNFENIYYNKDNCKLHIMRYYNYTDVYINNKIVLKLPIKIDEFSNIDDLICKIKKLIIFS